MNQYGNVIKEDVIYCNFGKDIEIMGRAKVAIYCRLSKEDEDKIRDGDDSASIQNQKLMLVDYALERGYHIYDIYSDDDYTGFDQNRPDFNRLLVDAKLKKFNTIICKTQSRFTRDMELVERYIHGLFPLLGIRFIGVSDNVDTNIKGNKKSRQINGLINEWYSEDLSENIRGIFKVKMEKGQFLGSFAPYGYKKDPNNKHKLIIDEEAAEVVRKIFQYVIQGSGVLQIAARLNDEGVLTPSMYKKMKGLNYQSPNSRYTSHGLWAVTTIKRMLKNRMYLGDMVQGRERKVSYKTTKCVLVPEEEWTIVPKCHEPIIELATFNLVQKILSQRKCVVEDKKTGERKVHLFAGKLHCMDCGAAITRVYGTNTYLYCKMYYKSKGKYCSKHSLIFEDLKKIVTDKIRNIINSYLSSEGISEVKKLISNDDVSEKRISQIKREIDSVRIKNEKLIKAISMLYVDKVNGKINDEEYIELKQELQQEKLLYIKRLDALDSEYNKANEAVDNIYNLETLIHKYADFKELTHEIVNEFIDYIEIGEKDSDKSQEIAIHWHF